MLFQSAFESKVSFILCTVRNDSIVELPNLAEQYITVVLENGEIYKYCIENPIKLIYKIPPSGIQPYSCSHVLIKSEEYDYNLHKYIISYVDGSICIFDDTKCKINEENEFLDGYVIYIKPELS